MRGQSFLRINPTGAVAAFTAALQQASPESRTYRASLLAQRADAQRRAGRRDAAETDLRAALGELQRSNSTYSSTGNAAMRRKCGARTFLRFGEAYQTLIRLLTDEGRNDEAFNYGEQARAFEPLYLVSEAASKEFDGKTKTLAEIRQALPAGTQLIEYSVLPDQTIAWLVSRERFPSSTCRPEGSIIERHASEVQRAEGVRNQTDFGRKVYALYDAVMAKPLAAIAAKPKRLVIVPDGPMHGLPFAALRNSMTHRYLIEDIPIEIAGSANCISSH